MGTCHLKVVGNLKTGSLRSSLDTFLSKIVETGLWIRRREGSMQVPWVHTSSFRLIRDTTEGTVENRVSTWPNRLLSVNTLLVSRGLEDIPVCKLRKTVFLT